MSQTHRIDDAAIDTIFRKARTFNRWQDRPVDGDVLRALYDLARMGPTAANSCPARFVFVTSAEGKARLKPHLDPGNVDKTMAAPVTVIMAMDMEFYEHLPKLFPHADARSWYAGRDALIEETAFRNASLQAAYVMIAARALGNSVAIVLSSEEKMVGLINEYAPEHLIISMKNYSEVGEKIINAGSVFLGNYTPESAGDYASGTNHTLPTNGWARSFSGVNIDSFIKKITFQEISPEGMKNLGPVIETMAAAEQLDGHRNAVTLRLNEIRNKK